MTLDSLQMNRILIKLTYIGLLMNVVVPIGIFAAFIYTSGQNLEFSGGFGNMESNVQLLFYALLVVSIMDIGMIVFIRRRIPAGILRVEGKTIDERFERAAFSLSLVYVEAMAATGVSGPAVRIESLVKVDGPWIADEAGMAWLAEQIHDQLAGIEARIH